MERPNTCTRPEIHDFWLSFSIQGNRSNAVFCFYDKVLVENIQPTELFLSDDVKIDVAYPVAKQRQTLSIGKLYFPFFQLP